MSKARHFQHLLLVAAPKVAHGVGLLSLNILLIRFFDPASYGAYSLCVASIIIGDAVIGSPLDLGVLRLAPLYRIDDRARSFRIEAAAFWLKMGLLLFLGIGLLLTAPALARLLFHRDGLTHLVYITYGALAATLMLRSCLAHLQVDKRFPEYGLVDWMNTLSKFGSIGVLLAFAERSPATVLIGFVFGPTLAFVIGMATFAWDRGWIMRFDASHLRELAGHLKWIVPVTAVGSIRDRMDIYFLTLWSTAAEVGIFSAARAVAMIPDLLGMYMGVVVAPRIMPLYRERRFYRPFKKMQIALKLAAVLILGGGIAALALAEPIVPEAYRPSIPVFIVLLAGTLTGFVSHPVVAPFLMFLRPRFALYLDLVAMPLMVAGYAYAIDSDGALGAAWVTAGARIVLAIAAHSATWIWVRRNDQSADGAPVSDRRD